MSAQLIRLAEAAIRSAALEAFRRSSLGRLVTEAHSAASRGALSSSQVRQFSQRLRSITSRNVSREIFRAMGLGELEQYARGTVTREMFDGFRTRRTDGGNMLSRR